MDTRIQVEEEIIQKAGLIITSTQQEIDRQYGLYENYRYRSLYGYSAGHRPGDILSVLQLPA